MRSKLSVRLPLRSARPALSTDATTPRIVEPAGTTMRPSRVRSTSVVASKRSSTASVPELSSALEAHVELGADGNGDRRTGRARRGGLHARAEVVDLARAVAT